jgi:hypothetical protein
MTGKVLVWCHISIPHSVSVRWMLTNLFNSSLALKSWTVQSMPLDARLMYWYEPNHGRYSQVEHGISKIRLLIDDEGLNSSNSCRFETTAIFHRYSIARWEQRHHWMKLAALTSILDPALRSFDVWSVVVEETVMKAVPFLSNFIEWSRFSDDCVIDVRHKE